MSYYVHFTPYNADFFVEKNAAFPSKYGYVPFGKGLSAHASRANQLTEQYYRLTTDTDPQCIYLLRGRVGTFEWNVTVLNFYDENHNLLKYINPTDNIDSCGVVDKLTGDDLDANVFQFRISDYAELSGKKYIQMEIDVTFGDGTDITTGTTKTYRCETLCVADVHDDTTSLFEYTHSANKDDVFFKDLSLHFSRRIYSNGMKESTGGEYVSFIDQTQQVVNQYGKSSPRFTWDIGGSKGLTFQEIDSIDNALNLDRLRIDGARYVRKDGGFSSSAGEGKHRQWRTAELGLYDDEDYRTFRRGTFKLYKKPDTYPFATHSVAVSDGFTWVGNAATNRVIDDGVDDDAFVAELNSDAASKGYSSTFEYADGYLVLIVADGEDFIYKGSCEVYHRCLNMKVTVAASADVFRWVLQYPSSTPKNHIACYGGVSSDSSERLTSSGGVTVATHTYDTAGTYTIRLFTQDNEVGYNFTQSTSYPVKINDASGEISNKTQAFRFSGHDFSGLSTLNLSFLANAKNEMKYLYLIQSNIVGITSGWASSLVSLPYKPFTKLGYIDATQNTFTSANVDSFINEYYNSVAYPSGYKYFGINGNTPSAPPTAASSTARTALIAALTTLNTD